LAGLAQGRPANKEWLRTDALSQLQIVMAGLDPAICRPRNAGTNRSRRRQMPGSSPGMTTFAGRILPLNTAAARIGGELSAGRSLPVVDTLIAATAITVFDPWDAQ
jgi:hypothetical protein